VTLAIGIDIGGTKVAGGVVDEAGTVIANVATHRERMRVPPRT
jgi:predicted NBD/HSP70 family sugar kinase